MGWVAFTRDRFIAVPGSIAFIRDGALHQFRRIAEALDVLVLWAR